MSDDASPRVQALIDLSNKSHAGHDGILAGGILVTLCTLERIEHFLEQASNGKYAGDLEFRGLPKPTDDLFDPTTGQVHKRPSPPVPPGPQAVGGLPAEGRDRAGVHGGRTAEADSLERRLSDLYKNLPGFRKDLPGPHTPGAFIPNSQHDFAVAIDRLARHLDSRLDRIERTLSALLESDSWIDGRNAARRPWFSPTATPSAPR